MKKKKCKDCNKQLSASSFYGLQGECKQCTKKRVRVRELELRKNPQWVEAEKKRGREKYHRLEYRGLYSPSPKNKSEALMRYKLKYPEKIAVRNASSHLKSKKGFNNHHWSYNIEHAKDVIELSIKNHNKLHCHIIYDQERKMYRRSDDMTLLDTKEKHLNYFKEINKKDWI